MKKCVVGSAAALLAITATASAARVALTMTPASVHRGGTVTVSGNAGSCPVADRVAIISLAFDQTHEFAGVPAVFATVLRGGAFRTSAHVPRSRPVGPYLVTARCGGGTFGVSVRLRVLR